MSWKQPIPTDLDNEFGDNKLAKWVYIFLLLRARNSNEEKSYAGAFHFLGRGQCVCGMQEIADEFRVNRKTATYTLSKLQKVYNKVDIKTTTKGTVVTVLNYDDVVSMGQQNGQQSNNKVTTEGQQSNTNKSVKSDKIVKSDESIVTVQKKYSKLSDLSDSDFQELAERYKVDINFVRFQHEKMTNWLASKGKVYKDYKRGLANWVLGDIQKAVERKENKNDRREVFDYSSGRK